MPDRHRRRFLRGTIAGVLAASGGLVRAQSSRASAAQIGAVRRALSGLTAALPPAELARADGAVYAADLALLALSAALDGDRERHRQLALLARRRFLVPGPSSRSRVVLRRRRLDPTPARPETAGAGESLLWAQALLAGAGVFGTDGDQRLGLELLDGYLAYAVELDTSWSIRTSFDLTTRRLSDLSCLADYGPDLLNIVAAHRDSERFRQAGTRALALMQRAQRPNGLIDAFMQPELGARTGALHFSPNGIVQIRDAACAAEQAAVGAPQLAGRVLRFVEPRLGTLRATYGASTGEPHGLEPADVATLSILGRAAVRTGDERFTERLRPLLLRHASWLLRQEGTPDVHLTAQALLALQFIELRDTGRELPAFIPWRRPPREG